jgi:CRISPR-associated endonuclease/helicase Cas3
VRPGFEEEGAPADAPFRLISHRLGKLLREDEYGIISARPRIQPRPLPERQPKLSLVDLEHARLAERMLPKSRDAAKPLARGVRPETTGLDAACAWQFPRAALTGALPQQQPFRSDDHPDVELLFLPDEDETRLIVHRVHEEARHGAPAIYTTAESQIERLSLEYGPRIAPWGRDDLFELLLEQAESRGLPLRLCGERFTKVTVPQSAQGWRFHPVLGFARKG